MFTGLIQHRGTVASLDRDAEPARLRLDLPDALAARSAPGDSIAVDGACLTVVDLEGGRAAFDVLTETLRRTTLGGLRPGDRVNLEPALRAGEPFGGHFVQGHVDGVGRIGAIEDLGGEWEMTFSAPAAVLETTVEKGSVAVDGISLTVAGLVEGGFRVAIIPETMERTGLGEKAAGASVNLEADVLGKYVARAVAARDRGPR